MKHTILACTALALLLSVAAIADDGPPQTYLLRYTPKTGDSAAYSIVMDAVFSIEGIPGAPTDAPMKMNVGLCMDTATVNPDGTFATKIRIDEMRMNMMGMDVDIMTHLAPAEPATGIEFTVVQDPVGRVVRIEGLDKLSGMAGGQDLGTMPQMFSPATNMSMAALPDKPVSVGEMWTPEMPATLAGTFEGTAGPPVQCWLSAIEDIDGQQCAKIRTRTLGKLDVTKATKAMGAANSAVPGLEGMKMNMDLDANTYTWIRLSDGRMMKIEGTGDIKMKMASGDKADDSAPQPAMGMPSNMLVKATYKLEMGPRKAK